MRLGDELVFDVQGLPVATRVGSLRKVEWERVQPNFFVVFPAGVLEDAPQFYVMVLKTGSNEESAQAAANGRAEISQRVSHRSGADCEHDRHDS